MVYPENAEQLKAVKAFLKALKVDFEPRPQSLPPHVLKGIEESIEQFNKEGKSISFDEFKKRHFIKK